MATILKTERRRKEVSKCLAKSLTTPTQIFNNFQQYENLQDIPLSAIKNDLYWMKKNSRRWLSDHAIDGFIFSTQNTLDQLRDIELELQKLRQETMDVSEKLSIIHELKETINMRWVMEGDGPTLMALSKFDK